MFLIVLSRNSTVSKTLDSSFSHNDPLDVKFSNFLVIALLPKSSKLSFTLLIKGVNLTKVVECIVSSILTINNEPEKLLSLPSENVIGFDLKHFLQFIHLI